MSEVVCCFRLFPHFFRFSPVAEMYKKKDSGHAKRKQKSEKLKREEELRESIPRLTTYFSRKTTAEQQAAAAEAVTTDPDVHHPRSPSK